MSVANVSQQLFRANRGYRAAFVQEMEAAEAQWMPAVNLLAMDVPSTGPIEEYNFSDAVPRMTEWKDERKISKLGVDGWTLKNVSYANGVEIDRDDLEDDKLGLYMPRIRELARQGVLHKFQLLRDLINNGATATYTAWDGQVFFSNSHPLADSASTNDNFLTPVLAEASLQTALAQLSDMRDSQGEYMNLKGTHLIFGNDLQFTAKDILQQERQASGETNIMRGTLQPLHIPGLTSTNWAVADLSHSLKPFVLQNRRGITFTDVTNPDSPEVFMRKRFMYGADWRGAMGYAHYQLMVMSDGST